MSRKHFGKGESPGYQPFPLFQCFQKFYFTRLLKFKTEWQRVIGYLCSHSFHIDVSIIHLYVKNNITDLVVLASALKTPYQMTKFYTYPYSKFVTKCNSVDGT